MHRTAAAQPSIPTPRGPITSTVTDPSLSASGVFPLRFAPILRTQVWGGRALETRLGKSLPTSELYGEAWEISPLDQAVSHATSPAWSGASLTELWARYPMWRGDQGATFPWLIKWLDCRDRLSVQVHPNAADSVRLTGRLQPKSEAWVIVQAEPTARVWAGCQPGVTADDLARHIDQGTVVDCLHEFTPQRGDCISLPAGTLHAAGGGLVIAEIQQPSDITYRLFDWNRVDSAGRPRMLHREQGLACLKWPQHPVPPTTPAKLEGPVPGVNGERLLSAPEFQLDRWTLTAPWPRETDEFAVWMVLHGRGELTCEGETQPVAAGQTLWFPAVPVRYQWTPAPSDPLVLLRITPSR